MVDRIVFGSTPRVVTLDDLWTLATAIPTLALNSRRLHDTNRSGWWQLIVIVPVVGWIVLLVWTCQRGENRPNRFG